MVVFTALSVAVADAVQPVLSPAVLVVLQCNAISHSTASTLANSIDHVRYLKFKTVSL